MESLILAAQDQAFNTRCHQRNMKQPTDSKCRMCYNAEEHIKHIVQGCTILAPSEYPNRHSKVAGYIHWTMCKCVGLHVTDRYHGHTPERVINVSGTTTMWDITVITDQTLLANQPHRVLHDKKEKTRLIIPLMLRSQNAWLFPLYTCH